MKLKPCPFCGETQVYVREEYRSVEIPYLPTTYSCGCEYDLCPAQPTASDTYTSEEEAIEGWNTRAERTCTALIRDNPTETEGQGEVWVECGECGAEFTCRCALVVLANYCPECGAKVVKV